MIKINGEQIVLDRFPNFEVLVKTDKLNEFNEKGRKVIIQFKWLHDEDLIHLYFVIQHLTVKSDLYIYYMPYSRMDRSQNGSCFTLQHVANLLNSLHSNIENIFILEPHSDVTLQLVENSKRINVITPLMKHILKLNPEINMICYPDKGAKARFQDDNVELPVVFCNKVRDFDTGEIKGLELDGVIDVADKNVLILDDLCSKGGTFYYTAKKLKENGANNIYLGVCHMEATVRHGEIYKQLDKWGDSDYVSPVKHIYCLNTMVSEIEGQMLQEYSENLTVYNVEDFLNNGEFKEVEEWTF
jgi:ribose-phosphate pyrophosphokinase